MRSPAAQFIRPGKPVENAFIERFNGRLPDEGFSTSWFLDLADSRALIDAGRCDYNDARSHSGLDPEQVCQRLRSG